MTFGGTKEIVALNSLRDLEEIKELFPSSEFFRVYLRTKEDIERAITNKATVFHQTITNEQGNQYETFYILVPKDIAFKHCERVIDCD